MNMKTDKPHLTFLEKIVEANPHASWKELAEIANAKANQPHRYSPRSMQRSANRLNLKLAGKLVPKPTKPIAPPNVLREESKVHPAFNLGRIIEYRLTMSFCGQELVGAWRKEPMSQFHKDCEAFAINRVWFTAEFKRD